jgi:NAD(P)-dependent dehydrogenase (short-subunit alcohol dehydrogenase family)
MAVHHGRDKIRVNCIAPGHLYGPFVEHVPDEWREMRRKAGPLGTEGDAWDVAWAAVFFASDESKWISGVVLPIDAGLQAATPLSVLHNLV